MFKSMIKKVIFAIMTIGLSSVQTLSFAANEATTQNNAAKDSMQDVQGMEKCYGIVKAGLNDCSNSLHDCSGGAKADRDGKEWVFVPTGLCSRIVGGSTTASKS